MNIFSLTEFENPTPLPLVLNIRYTTAYDWSLWLLSFCSLNAAIIQKRLKKEKKAKRKLQEALEYESKRREQAEQSLKQTSPTESLRSLNGETPYQKVNMLKCIKGM